jgi:hypothetical protein
MQLTPAKKAAPTYRDGFFILATFFSHCLVVDWMLAESWKASGRRIMKEVITHYRYSIMATW